MTPIDPAILERVRTALEFAKHKRFVAVAIDVADGEALLAAVQAEPDVLRTAFDVRRLYHDWRWKGLAPHRRPVMGEEIDDSVAFGLYVHRLPRASWSGT